MMDKFADYARADDFVRDAIEFDARKSVSLAVLRLAFREWAHERGLRWADNRKAIGAALRRIGISATRRNGRSYVDGVKVRHGLVTEEARRKARRAWRAASNEELEARWRALWLRGRASPDNFWDRRGAAGGDQSIEGWRVYSHYEDWSDANRLLPISEKEFWTVARRYGFTRDKHEVVHGVMLKPVVRKARGQDLRRVWRDGRDDAGRQAG
jgi:hypothetical protein